VPRSALFHISADEEESGAYHATDKSLLPVGGKTGTGDNRLDRFGRGGRLISQRVVDCTATFVFFLGDRFFGTITAYVPGSIAGSYHFTSAIAVQLLKALEPELQPLLGSPVRDAPPMPIGEAPPLSDSAREDRCQQCRLEFRGRYDLRGPRHLLSKSTLWFGAMTRPSGRVGGGDDGKICRRPAHIARPPRWYRCAGPELPSSRAVRC
jgi:hypothetical protein